MDDCERCPTCGRDRPAGASKGLCPLCQVRRALGLFDTIPPHDAPQAPAPTPEPAGVEVEVEVASDPVAERAQADALRERREEADRLRRWMVVGAVGTYAMAAGLMLGGWGWAGKGRSQTRGIERTAEEITTRRAEDQPPAPSPSQSPSGEDRASWAPGVEVVGRDRTVERVSGDPRAGGQEAAPPADGLEPICAAEEADRGLIASSVETRDIVPVDDPDGSARDLVYAGAFRAYGVEPDTLPPAEAAVRIKARPGAVVLEIAGALDDWAAVRRGRGEREGANRLTEVARLVDPDPWRDRLRSALLEPDRAASLAGLVALARSTPVADVPATGVGLLGRSLAELGDLPAAEAVLRRAQQQHPADDRVNRDLAAVLARLGRDDEAIRYETAARSIRPESAHGLAHHLERAGELDGAVAVYRDLARRRPGQVLHLLCLGRALKDSGRTGESEAILDSAITACRRSAQLRPGDAQVRDVLGRVLLARGRTAEAVAEFREAVAIVPDFAGARVDLGVALNDLRETDAALAEFRRAVLLQPGYAEARRRLGYALSASGRFDEAALEFREAVRARPEDVSAYDDLGSALTAGGRFDEAVVTYRAAIARRPDLALLHNRLGVLLFDRRRDSAGAVAEFREAVRLRPDFTEAHFNLGNALRAEGRVVEALAETREAIRLKPDYAEAHVNVGLILRGDGRLPEAIAAYREAILIRPDFAAAHLCLGNALSDRGDLNAAAQAYREALRLKPNDPEARRLLESLSRAEARTASAPAPAAPAAARR